MIGRDCVKAAIVTYCPSCESTHRQFQHRVCVSPSHQHTRTPSPLAVPAQDVCVCDLSLSSQPAAGPGAGRDTHTHTHTETHTPSPQAVAQGVCVCAPLSSQPAAGPGVERQIKGPLVLRPEGQSEGPTAHTSPILIGTLPSMPSVHQCTVAGRESFLRLHLLACLLYCRIHNSVHL